MTTRNLLNGGQVIVDYLVREGVPYVFGLCGHGNIGLLDALFERASDIKTISTHHETVAGFMADVYYRVAGKPVATLTSCGPGSANLPIALGNAFLDSVPFLAITGNVPTSQFNRGAFQELYRHYQADFPSTVRACCKRVFQPTRGDMVPLAIRQAWKTMVSGRPGPVVLHVPFDIFKEAAGEETPRLPRQRADGPAGEDRSQTMGAVGCTRQLCRCHVARHRRLPLCHHAARRQVEDEPEPRGAGLERGRHRPQRARERRRSGDRRTGDAPECTAQLMFADKPAVALA